MKIHREGYRIIAVTGIICLIISSTLTFLIPHPAIIHYLIWSGFLVFFGIVVRFFRIPNRELKSDPEIILCPADGTIVAIEEVIETEYFKDLRRQVSIFMSPSNVHVNRYPIDGKIVYTNYWPGSFLVAWHPKSSVENERNTVVIENKQNGPILVRQVAGALARRIVCYAKTNERIEQGCELGFIKFGSRVDLFLPLSTQIHVKLEEKVKGGVSVIGTFPKKHEN